MNVSDIQMLMAEVGWYQGAIDGDPGPLTWAAVRRAEQLRGTLYVSAPSRWSDRRRLIAAGQAALHLLNFQPGLIDGYAGTHTNEALTVWRSQKLGSAWRVERLPVAGARRHVNQALFPRQKDMAEHYGPAGGPQCTAGKVELAYPMVIAWNTRQTIRSFSCHAKIAQPLTDIFRHALGHYGQAEIDRLQLNLFGGCFSYRNRRGGTGLSVHAYGAAVDLNPLKNQLRWGADRAQFAGPEYAAFWAIVMAHGGTPAGYAWGKDWMHFQFARL